MDLPGWVPEAARNYLSHTESGEAIRAIARRSNVHASTVLRQVRRFEALRDDPLIDEAMKTLSTRVRGTGPQRSENGIGTAMEHKAAALPGAIRMDPANGATGPGRPSGQGATAVGGLSEGRIEYEAVRILRRLVEPGTVLAVARDMEMGVVVRDVPGGPPERLAVVERVVAEAMALKDWIACVDPAARISRYQATAAGKAALRQLIGAVDARTRGFSEAQAAFDAARAERAEADDGLVRHMRTVLAESPLTALARRRDKEGRPFLDRELVAAGERLREDFELGQSGAAGIAGWEALLAGEVPAPAARARDGSGGGQSDGAKAARDRVMAALHDLGPGLADVTLRCCCFLEGLETLERRMGWSARSGKIVLRIALQRLRRHYRETQGQYGPKIG
ncbi:MAG: helix-turn-helix domain-containing protein [Rubellimicrobium sp.]|nr:helix-turn-helix domain-containing protein [Rubellimicrobium sp.]